jgi:hypothetical protein
MQKHQSRKATSLEEIDQAVKFNEPVGPAHPFYTDFSQVRGDFREKIVYRILNVKTTGGKFAFDPELNSGEKKLFFLGGMRGSGKTSELTKYAKNLHRPECFFVVTCNIDEALDMNDVEYMDVLIYQLERLANQSAQYLTQEKLDKLREIHLNNEQGLPTPFDELIDEMLEDIILMEYNTGSYKRVNPVVAHSVLYQQRILDKQ